MADEVIQDNIITLLIAGHDSTSITLALLLKYLHLHPHCLSKLIQEQREIAEEKKGAPLDWNDTRRMKYTWQVVQETMRNQPTIIAGFREAVQDFQYGGFSILKGWRLCWAAERSCHNPAYFPDPEKFDPSRFEGSGPSPFVWLPFGAGPRICLGNEFARTEIAVFLHHIALQFKWEMVDPQEAISINPLSIFKHGMQLNIWKSEGQKQGN